MTLNITECPFCQSKNFEHFIKTVDYSNTQETFDIYKCNNCTGAFTQNIPNEATIGPYYNFAAYVSHNNEAKGLINNLYLKARNYTLNKKIQWLKKYVKQNQITLADVGAGTGAFVHYAQSKNINSIGFEPDDKARQVAKESYQIQLENSSSWFNHNASFDAISLWHVLEHLHSLDAYMQSFYQKLNANGKLFIAVPNYASADATFYKQFWAAYDVPRHLYHFNAPCMAMLAEKYNFTIEATIPMWLDGYYVSMLSEKHKKASLGFIKGVFRGLLTHVKILINKNNASSLVYVLRKKN
jgi:SAM-dependent methyltransferase